MSEKEAQALMASAVGMAKDWDVEHPCTEVKPSSFLAHAWMLQIRAEADAYYETASDVHRAKIDRARRIAGEYANDVVHGVAGQPAMIHRLKILNKDVVGVAFLLGGCVPLWVHYYSMLETIDALIAEAK